MGSLLSWITDPVPGATSIDVQDDDVWAYVLIFLMMLLSCAGMPFVGTLAVGGGAVLASQHHLLLAPVLVAAVIGGEIGGIAGYWIGVRWGRQLMQRPGRRQEQRLKVLERGEQLYAKWGRLAVFVTTAMISGTARMKFSQFVVWNLITVTAFVMALGPTSYGAGKIARGEHDPESLAMLALGLAVAVGIAAVSIVHRRRQRARRAESRTPGDAQDLS